MKTLVNSLNCRPAAWALALCALLISAFALRAEEISIDLVSVWEKDPQGIQIRGAKFSPDGAFIYCAIDNNIHKLDAKTGIEVSAFKNEAGIPVENIEKLEVAKTGKYIITKNSNQTHYLWDAINERVLKEIKLKDQQDNQSIDAIALYPNGYEAFLTLYTVLQPPPVLPKVEMLRYNIETETIESRVNSEISIGLAEVSNNGKFIATTAATRGNDDMYIEYVKIWDAETFKEVQTLENRKVQIAKGYRILKISKDDHYVGWIRNHSDGPYIYDLEKNVLIRTTDFRLPTTFEFLPDSLHYAVYFDWEGQYALEIRNIKTDKKVYSHVYGAQILESVKSIDGNTYLYDYGDYFTRVFKVNKTIGVINPTNESNIEIVVKNNKLFLKSTAIEYINVSISDIRGKEVFKTQIKSHIKNELIPLDIILNSGVYLCRIVSDTVEYTQKIEIVR